MEATLNQLNKWVTQAISLAEDLPVGSLPATYAWLLVASLEQKIANITSPLDLEGQIARRGVVSAFIQAGNETAASAAREHFLREIPSDSPEADALREVV